MSQFKAAMERIHTNGPATDSADGHEQSEEEGESTLKPLSTSTAAAPPAYANTGAGGASSTHHPPLISFLQRHAAFLLMPVLPLLWCILLVCTLDRDELLSASAMPLLGIGSAALANAVPVGGGIVFIPILSLFNVHIALGASFAVATMTFGNGIFGFLNWLQKDPSAIAWHIIPSAVIPAWIGAAIGTFRPLMTSEHCRTLFALFAIKVAVLVWRGLYVGRRNMRGGKPFSLVLIPADEEDANDGCAAAATLMTKSRYRHSTRIIACICSFLAGLILVAHIGIGNAVTTFLVSSFVWRLPPKSAVVTSIIVGGWTSFAPFLIHLLILKDVPIALWVMGLPGVYLGARMAPVVHERIGIVNVLAAFVLFLVATAVLMVST